jgi:hypothetical protein
MPLCEYGCRREATTRFKNGKWCCSKSKNSCQKNKLIGNKNPFYGKTHSAEKREEMGIQNIGKKPWNKGVKGCFSEETLKKISESGKGRPGWLLGKHHSEEAKKKMRLASLGRPGNMIGKKHSIETRKKLRQIAIKRIEERYGGQIHPNYNPAVCALMDEYGKKHGYNFKHAMNGGEHYFKELGYWVDGYDVERNTVFEGDEKHHFDSEGNLLEKDVIRQKEIIDHYGCKFIRSRI